MKFLKRFFIEKWIFAAFAIANIIPLFLIKYVASLDGPSHLYVSNVIAQLIKGNDLYQSFFSANHLIIGNISGNYLIGIFNVFLPAWIAEKFLLATILLTFTYGFRYLVISVKGKPDYLSILIFPFSYHALFLLGYYNFSLAIGFMFITLGLWIKITSQFKLKWFILFIVASILTYYSHLVVFSFLLLISGLYTAFITIRKWVSDKKTPFRQFLIHSSLFVSGHLPGMVLGFLYFRIVPGTTSGGGGMTIAERFDYITNMDMLIGFVHSEERPSAQIILYLLTLLLVVSLISRIFSFRKNREKSEGSAGFFQFSDIWLVISGILLLMFLFLPDHMSLPKRVLLMMIPLLILWIANQKIPYAAKIVSLLIIVASTTNLRTIHLKQLKPLDRNIREIRSIESLIPENTTILSANYSKNWIKYHFEKYVGIDKPLPDLNSPTISPLFAVNWNKNNRPFAFVGTTNASSVCHYFNQQKYPGTVIAEYIVIVGYLNYSKAETPDKLQVVIARDYELIHVTEAKDVALFRFNRWDCVNQHKQFIVERPSAIKKIEEKATMYSSSFEAILLRDAIWLCDQSLAE